MAIQNRRGFDKDFDPDKMVPAEIAITTDGTRKIYVCFSAGDVIELLSAIETEFTEEELQRCVDNYLSKNPLQLDETLTDNSKAAPAGIVGDIKSDKINIPKDSNGNTLNGTSGQILQTNGDGTTQWVNKPEVGTSGDEVSAHNTDGNAHSDIRNLIGGKVSSTDIADNLKTNNSNKVLSAAQGAKLREMIEKLDDNYVTLEMFGGSGDGTTINDDAFAQAMKSGYNLALQGGKTYLFSGDYIDLGNHGKRIIIQGNNATVKKLSFKWNIDSSNNRVVASAVDEFPISFENIKFVGNVNPIILTASNVDVKRCNFSGCAYCFAFPEYYIDYFHMSDCYFYSTDNVISTFDYDGTEKEYGVYGDWFVFERCHFSFADNAKVFENSPNHGGSVYFINCLHGIYTINNSTYYRYRFIFKGHHFEKGIIINNTPTIPIPQGFVKISDSYMYSTSFPDAPDGITLDNVEINYGNSGNYKLIECEKGRYIKKFAEQIIEFDEFEFRHGEKSASLSTPLKSSNYYTSGTVNSKSYKKYDAVHTFKYALATSLEKDRLYFDGQTSTIYFSDEFTNTENRTCACSVSWDCYTRLKNVYLHIFKYMDGVLYRCVIPITRYLKSDATVDSNKLFGFYDEPEGVFGCPWVEYDGTVEYEIE